MADQSTRRRQMTIRDVLGEELTPEQLRKIIAIFGFTKPRPQRRSQADKPAA